MSLGIFVFPVQTAYLARRDMRVQSDQLTKSSAAVRRHVHVGKPWKYARLNGLAMRAG
jgi:hypothetical protein